MLPHHLDADAIVDEIKRQLIPLAERGRRPEVIEMSEHYAAQLDSRVLRGHLVIVVIDQSGGPAFGGDRSDAFRRQGFCA